MSADNLLNDPPQGYSKQASNLVRDLPVESCVKMLDMVRDLSDEYRAKVFDLLGRVDPFSIEGLRVQSCVRNVLNPLSDLLKDLNLKDQMRTIEMLHSMRGLHGIQTINIMHVLSPRTRAYALQTLYSASEDQRHKTITLLEMLLAEAETLELPDFPLLGVG